MYLLPVDDSFNIIFDLENLPEKYKAKVIEIESLPEGEGILRRAEDGTFYYEPFPEPTPIEPVVPIEPEQSQPTETELMQAKILLNTEMLLIYKEIEMEME